jgi:hypothetical protein
MSSAYYGQHQTTENCACVCVCVCVCVLPSTTTRTAGNEARCLLTLHHGFCHRAMHCVISAYGNEVDKLPTTTLSVKAPDYLFLNTHPFAFQGGAYFILFSIHSLRTAEPQP